MAGSFAKEVARFERDAVQAAEDAFIWVSLSMFNEVIKKTPVLSGRLRGNWQTTINSGTPGPTDRLDPSGGAASGEAAQVTQGAQLGDMVVLGNNLPYAERIEGGYSSRAPGGMVALTVQQYQAFAQAAGLRFRLR